MEKINSINFSEKIKKGRVLIDFFADWCGPCQMLTPVLEELAAQYPNVMFYQVDCDVEKELCKQYKIISIPVLLFFIDGKLIKEINGFQSKTSLERFLSYYECETSS